MAKLNRADRKHSRKENVKTPGPGNYLIVTEGIETEVNYFNGIKRSNALFDNYNNCSSPTKMNPCTKVQDLVEDLVKYIK